MTFVLLRFRVSETFKTMSCLYVCACFTCCKTMVNFVIFFDTVYYCSQMLAACMCCVWPQCALMKHTDGDFKEIQNTKKKIQNLCTIGKPLYYSFNFIRKSSLDVHSLDTQCLEKNTSTPSVKTKSNCFNSNQMQLDLT